MKIARACGRDAGALTEIAFAAKRHWDYPESWIRRWEGILTITPEYIDRHLTFVAVKDEAIVGFYAVHLEASDAQLDHLWVLPSCMGRGVGRMLFQHAVELARASGANRLSITGDPHAE